MKKTKIIATVGPACRDEEKLRSLISSGVDIFRINASHSSIEDMAFWFRLIRRISKEMDLHVGILVDLQGPRIRTGKVKNGPLVLETGTDVIIYIRPDGAHPDKELTVSSPKFYRMVKKSDTVLIDNGAVELRVNKVQKTNISCRVVHGGRVGDNKGINLPNAPITLPALTEKDLIDLKAASNLQADYIALSFVRNREDILTIKSWMKKNKVQIPVIAKIEKPRAVHNLDSILPLVDGVMVARGDLGIEMGIEKVPRVQKMIIEKTKKYHIPVITATQMLESMMTSSQPSRAEVSDIANAVFDGTDAVMLSGETSIGRYPEEAVRIMRNIIREAEGNSADKPVPQKISKNDFLMSAGLPAIAHAALNAAREAQAKAIVIFTHTGRITQHLSKLNPNCPLIAATKSERTLARMSLLRGVRPIYVEKTASFRDMCQKTENTMIRSNILKKGDIVILISGPWAFPDSLFLMAIHRVGEKASQLT